MKICIDGRCLIGGRRTGVEEYTRYLLENIFEADSKNEFVIFLNSWKKSKTDFFWAEKFPNVKIRKFYFPNKVLNFLFWYFNWPKIDIMVGGADLVFMPNIVFGAISKKCQLVLTVHDLSFLRYAEYFSQKRRWWHIFINPRKICRKANKIIAVSESTKNDLINLYGIKKEKIEVIPSSCSGKFRVIGRNDPKLIEIKEKYSLPYKFILYLGTIEPRKNIISLVRAYNKLQEKADNLKNLEIKKFSLIIAGASGWLSEEIFEEIERSPFSKKIKVINFVPEEEKEFIYNLASLFVYPSFFEGFGFPPLEAMSSGVPIICSNNSSLPEIVGSAAIMIDADKPDEIFRAMNEVLENKEFESELISRGLEKSSKFDWGRTAQKTLDVFEKMRKNHKK